MMDCPVCAFADEHHWWGRDGTHCRKCHRSWTSRAEAHCTTCCAHFTKPSTAGLHLTARGCQPPEAVMDREKRPKLKLVERSSGPTWARATEFPESLRGRDSSPANASGGQK